MHATTINRWVRASTSEQVKQTAPLDGSGPAGLGNLNNRSSNHKGLSILMVRISLFPLSQMTQQRSTAAEADSGEGSSNGSSTDLTVRQSTTTSPEGLPLPAAPASQAGGTSGSMVVKAGGSGGGSPSSSLPAVEHLRVRFSASLGNDAEPSGPSTSPHFQPSLHTGGYYDTEQEGPSQSSLSVRSARGVLLVHRSSSIPKGHRPQQA